MSGAAPLPGGTLLRAAHWVAEHCVGPLGLGTAVVKPVRHVLHLADLTAEESAELGPLLARISEAVTSVSDPEQVYVCLWSHAGGVPGHLHFVVQPVSSADMAEFGCHGPALQVAMFERGVVPGRAEVEAVCDRLRAALGPTDADVSAAPDATDATDADGSA
ncbi:HIT family protein [Streptomyces sp. NPDC049040]|uniref:HIT family protein n=1 Tax=Streptomyces sp. NPDC049040 TaxID=3365593 RepID=UPI00371DFADB